MKRTLSMLLALLMLLGCFSGITFAAEKTVTEPKVIANSAAATTEAAVIENPSDVKIWEPRKLTDAERTTLIQDIGLAYYYQSDEVVHIQYDGKNYSKVSSMARHADDGRPEDAWYDSIVYSVCSNYCWKIYHEAYNHPLFRMKIARTRTWVDFPVGTPEVVYQYTGAEAQNSKGETDLAKAVVESRKVVQAGDIVVYANKSGGHAMMYMGDLFGDGTDYMLHCRGDSFQDDYKEYLEPAAQAIELMKADEAVWSEKGKCSLYAPSHVSMGFAILRPTLDPAFPELPTAEAMARLQFRRMKITRELDRYKFAGAMTGEEIPVYVTVENKGTTDYAEVPVEEYIPAGTTYVEGSATKGVKIEGSTLKWAVKVPAGKKITLTYKVKITAKLGETVEFKGGLVGGIASRTTSLLVVGKDLTEAQQTAIFEQANKVKGAVKDDYRDLGFVNKLYEDAIGVNPGLPRSVNALLKDLTEVKGEGLVRTGKGKYDGMVLPLHFTGQYAVADNIWDQTRDHKEEFYKPGDVFVGLLGSNTTSVEDSSNVEIMVYLGQGKLLVYTPKTASVQSIHTIIRMYALKYNILIALRPTQVFEDINTSKPTTVAFADVKEADWFYTYVKDLVTDGVVNGMTATTFAPNGTLTYGQSLKLITVAVTGEEQAKTDAHWASGYLKYAQDKKWVDGAVDLEAKITRLEFCKIAAKAKNLTKQPAENPFRDCKDTSVLALVEAGVISGMTKNTFAPNGQLTRAQISKIIWCLQGI